MTTNQGIAITYTGRDKPFKDRIYRSGLTFEHGQTRTVPEVLAARFLRHADVFKRAELEAVEQTQQKQDEPQVDDTAKLLEQTQQKQDELRKQEDARFELIDRIESMDKKGLIEWAQINYKQAIDGRTSEAKAREIVKGFIDQYGVP